jgi:dihydropteroate synthase
MRLVGILNVTPDSFSDGGRYVATDAAIAHGRRLFEEGADWVDVGGESTRPGARPVPTDEEISRVVPVVRALAPLGCVSIDTRHAAVAEAALAAGARVVNDVSAGADPEMLPLVAGAACTIVLMHMRGDPATMQSRATYADVCAEVWRELDERVEAARHAGVADDRIVLDPGIGFAKTAAHNLAILRDLPRRTARPVLLGASRKAFLGALTGQDKASDRLEGSLAVALHARDAGVAYLRVHDVAATRRALAVWDAIRGPA